MPWLEIALINGLGGFSNVENVYPSRALTYCISLKDKLLALFQEIFRSCETTADVVATAAAATGDVFFQTWKRNDLKR